MRGFAAVRELTHEVASLLALIVREWAIVAVQNGRQFVAGDWGRELRLAFGPRDVYGRGHEHRVENGL